MHLYFSVSAIRPASSQSHTKNKQIYPQNPSRGVYIFIEGLLRTLRKGLDGTSNTELSKNPTSSLSLSLKCQAPYRYTHFFLFFFFFSSSESLLSGIWLPQSVTSSTSSQNTSYFYQKLHFIEKEGERDCVTYSLVFFSCLITISSIMQSATINAIYFFPMVWRYNYQYQ